MRLADPCWSARRPAGFQIRLGAWWGVLCSWRHLGTLGLLAHPRMPLSELMAHPLCPFRAYWVILTVQVELLFALSRTGVLFILLTSRQGIHRGRDPGFPSGHHPE